jgi:hypothetical protein
MRRPSAAVRLYLEIRERGLSLRGVTFMLLSEPLTRARRQVIEGAGIGVSAMYAFAEGGNVGAQCSHPVAADDVHVFLDAYAVIQRAVDLGDGAGRPVAGDAADESRGAGAVRAFLGYRGGWGASRSPPSHVAAA